jgi:adenine C2-methylase RlmN of 23S rRNA A2503 and tRNA A37
MGGKGEPMLNLEHLVMFFHLFIVKLGVVVSNKHAWNSKSSYNVLP